MMGATVATLSATDDRAGRTAGFAALYDCHVAEVYRFVHRRCRDRAVAEDVTQDAFLTAVRTVDDPAEITIGWLITVARNRLLDLLRRQARHSGKLRLLEPRADEADGGEVVADRMQMCAALEHLDVEHRLVLMLHYVDGLTIAELADELGRSPKAAEALMTRARRKLRRELERSDA